MSDEKRTESLNMRIAPELKKKLQAMADKDNRKLADFIHIALENLVKNKK